MILIVLLHRFVLDKILSDEATEIVVEKIHEYLATLGEDVRAGKIPLDDYIIFKVGVNLLATSHY